MPADRYSYTRPLHEMLAGNNLPADLMQSLVDRANRSIQHIPRGNISYLSDKHGTSAALQKAYPCYFFLVVGDLTLEKSDDVPLDVTNNDDWVYADCMEWSFHQNTNRCYIQTDEHVERVYFPHFGTNTAPFQGIGPVDDFNDYTDFNDDNWQNVIDDFPCSIVCAHIDSDTGRLVSLAKPNSPQLINVELVNDIAPPTPPAECTGPHQAYLLHYPPEGTCKLERCDDVQVEVWSRACFPLKAGEKYKAEKFKACGQECGDGRYFLRWRPPPTVVGITKAIVPAYSGTCPGVGNIDRVIKVQDEMMNWCDETTTQVIQVLNPCSEIAAGRRIHASLVDETNCLYEISLDCCDE